MVNMKAKEIAACLNEGGVQPGDSLLVHSSFKSFQGEASPDAVIEGLLNAIGEKGTLLFPALTYEFVTAQNPVFDYNLSKSCVGFLAEYFRTHYACLRSFHPTHSVCGYGKQVQAILEPHRRDRTPAGKNSPFYLNRQYGGKILMIGCGLGPNTTMHAVEEEARPPYLFKSERQRYKLIRQDQVFAADYEVHDFQGYEQRYDRIAGLLDDDNLRKINVLSAETFIINSQNMWTMAKKKLEEDPLFFVDKSGEQLSNAGDH